MQVYSRVDVIFSANGRTVVLEINTIPGMTEASLLPEAAAVAGISYVDLCVRIIALSRARRKERGNERQEISPVCVIERVSNVRQRRQQHLLDVKVRSRRARSIATAESWSCSPRVILIVR